MTFAEAAEHARSAADKADTASLISGLFVFSDELPRDESEYPRGGRTLTDFVVGHSHSQQD